MSIRIINNVPANKVDFWEQLLRTSGALDVTRAPETDGEFTLIVVYPDTSDMMLSPNECPDWTNSRMQRLRQ